jgi:hypothetical protein
MRRGCIIEKRNKIYQKEKKPLRDNNQPGVYMLQAI